MNLTSKEVNKLECSVKNQIESETEMYNILKTDRKDRIESQEFLLNLLAKLKKYNRLCNYSYYNYEWYSSINTIARDSVKNTKGLI